MKKLVLIGLRGGNVLKPKRKKILGIVTLFVVIGLVIGLTLGCDSSSESSQPGKTLMTYCGKPSCPEAICTTGGNCGCN